MKTIHELEKENLAVNEMNENQSKTILCLRKALEHYASENNWDYDIIEETGENGRTQYVGGYCFGWIVAKEGLIGAGILAVPEVNGGN